MSASRLHCGTRESWHRLPGPCSETRGPDALLTPVATWPLLSQYLLFWLHLASDKCLSRLGNRWPLSLSWEVASDQPSRCLPDLCLAGQPASLWPVLTDPSPCLGVLRCKPHPASGPTATQTTNRGVTFCLPCRWCPCLAHSWWSIRSTHSFPGLRGPQEAQSTAFVSHRAKPSHI